ncbi:MAG: oligosaccharyl transferase, archaeosortase A system-associated [Dehalococcoidia bacterium]
MSRFVIGIRSSTRAKYGIALTIIFGIAFFLRVYFPYEHVFAGDWVRFQQNDPWYHMRVIENFVQHFPHLMPFDPYGFYPDGQVRVTAPFYDLLLGFFIWIFGAGSPTKGLIETLSAYFPAILGALVTIPTFFIGKALFNKKAGLLAAALIAILPGEFLFRTLLGFNDHHAAEILFSTIIVLFLILAVKSAKQKDVSFDSLRRKDWGTLREPLIYSGLTGIALGLYLLSWTGGALFIFIIFVFATLQYVIDHLRGRPTDYLCVVGVPVFLVALVLIAFAPGGYSLWNIQIASLVIGILAFLALSGISFLMTYRNIRPAYYPLTLAALVGIGLGLFYLIDPSLLDSMLGKLDVLNPTGGKLTISEVKGLSLSAAWEFFSTGFYLSLISLVIIAYLVIKESAADKTLLLVWSLIMLIASFGQQRFAYYLAVNVALLTAYFSWRMLEFAGFKEASEEVTEEELDRSTTLQKEMEKPKPSKIAKRKKEKTRKRNQEALGARVFSASHIYGLIALVVVFFLVFYPNIGKAIDWAEPQRGPSDDWHDALIWMKENTPEPFQDADFYYELYEGPAAGESYSYPESAYGVMSWWDPGYWITYIAHRIPNANPSGSRGAYDAASFLLAQDEASASEILDKLGSKYVILDNTNAFITLIRDGRLLGEFHAFVTWANRNQSEFYEVCYQVQAERLSPVFIYYPAYYQSMCSRLYIFGGQEWVPQKTLVVSLIESPVIDIKGDRVIVKVIADEKSFTTYEDAKAFVEAYPDYRIVGTDPAISPVPLGELEHYDVVYKSPTSVLTRGEETISEVEIFEYFP